MVDNDDPKSHSINPGYPLGQLARALTTAEEHPDPATRRRAEERAARWAQVFQQLLDGGLQVGSRTPLKEVPPWVTLEVVTGGFATGALLAGGPIQEHEHQWLPSPVPEEALRGAVNRYLLSNAGLSELQQRLRSACYRIKVPEEGALLVVAWLAAHGHVAAAQDLLEVLAPWFQRLRFYPVPTDHPETSGVGVYRQDVATTRASLAAIQPKPRLQAQAEAIERWRPLADRCLALWLETVAGAPPDLERDAHGKPRQGAVIGGWPCQHYPGDWPQRARQLLSDYQTTRQQHRLCGKSERSKENFCQLRGFLARAVEDPAALEEKDRRRIRELLARSIAKHGLPDSPRWRDWRKRQTAQLGTVSFPALAQLLNARLDAYPADGGIDELGPVLQNISASEAVGTGIPPETAIPMALQRKLRRCQRASVAELVEQGIVGSAELLAEVLPQLTATIRAAGIQDPTLRALDGAIYRAFQRRRSLLLLNLESQVRLEELPWVAALAPFRQDRLAGRELARQTLQEVAVLAITAFPHSLLPNRLIQQCHTLASRAGLTLPLVEEVAADIFMGAFTDKFRHAAQVAATLLDGSLYASYYGIDYSEIQRLAEPGTSRQDRFNWQDLSWKDWRLRGRKNPVALSQTTFFQVCERRAGVSYGDWRTAVNGMIIEQQQILTTHNLAVLFAEFGLHQQLRPGLDGLARRNFQWIVQRLQQPTRKRHHRLIALKNCAYAWRQMVFFLSLAPEERQARFLPWAEAYLGRQDSSFQRRFRPALLGLQGAMRGEPDEALCFTGWSQGSHWLA